MDISALTVATDVTDSEGDALTATLTNEASTTGGLISPLFSVTPTLVLEATTPADGSSVIVLTGGVATPDANGIWTAIVLLTDGVTSPVSYQTVATVTVTVTAAPDDAEYTVAADLTVAATEANIPVVIPELTVATGVRDVDGDLLFVSLADASVVNGALTFDTAPTVSLDASGERVILSGGIASADTNGEWTATVLLTDDASTPNTLATLGVVTVTVAPAVVVPNDPPTFTAGADLLAEATETDTPVDIPAITVATDVTDSEGDALTATLTNEASTTGGLISPLFATSPTVVLVATTPADGSSVIVLTGGVATPDAKRHLDGDSAIDGWCDLAGVLSDGSPR